MIAPEPIFRAYAELLHSIPSHVRTRSRGGRRLPDDELQTWMAILSRAASLLTSYEELLDFELRMAAANLVNPGEEFVLEPIWSCPIKQSDSSEKRLILAPDAIMRAFLDVVIAVANHVQTGARAISDDDLHDLMSAIHNVPAVLTSYGRTFNEKGMRDYFGYCHDYKRPRGERLSLIAVLDEAMARYRPPTSRARLFSRWFR